MYGLNDRPTIWVVDDDKSIRWVLDKALQKTRLPYRMFANGQEVLDAMEVWQKTPTDQRQPGDYPALLLTDIRMPEVDGLTILQAFREEAPHIPVIMMTAHADLNNAVTAFQHGACEYIAKPFDTNELIHLIKRLLQPQNVNPSTLERQQHLESVAGQMFTSEMTQIPPDMSQGGGHDLTVDNNTDKGLAVDGFTNNASSNAQSDSQSNPVSNPANAFQNEQHKQVLQLGILGKSQPIINILRTIGRLSSTQVNVLVTGETGTGKELVARAIHSTSHRSAHPFVTVNLASIPEHLLESELFGHEKGAFHDQASERIGWFEKARGGTLFLDDVDDVPLALQSRLIRMLSEGCFYRVGGNQLIRADVRIIAASDRDLNRLVQSGEFRNDLYHRLNVVGLHLPPLRERKEDIPLLMDYFLSQAAKELVHPVPKSLSQAAMKVCEHARWPGNIRQLQNVCRWLTVMVPTNIVNEAELPMELAQDQDIENLPHTESIKDIQGGLLSWQDALRITVRQSLNDQQPAVMVKLQQQFEQVVISEALKYTHNHRQNAAQLLGIGRNTITRKFPNDVV